MNVSLGNQSGYEASLKLNVYLGNQSGYKTFLKCNVHLGNQSGYDTDSEIGALQAKYHTLDAGVATRYSVSFK